MSGGVRLEFWSAVHSVESGGGGRLATFYVMDTGLNRNNWRVTDGALAEALPGLVGKPLGCMPGYRVNHVHEPLRVGSWLRVEKSDGRALATAEITDPKAWERLNSGAWGPVSVVIRAHRVSCSVCGRDITEAPDEHVASGEGHEMIEGFRFVRVDFVANPAYPRADLVRLGDATLRPRSHWGSPSFHSSLSILDGPQGAQGFDPNPEERREKGEMESNIAELRQELNDVREEKTTLESRLRALEAERHEERVAAALDARMRAGLVRDRRAEAERLRGLDASTLSLLKEDADGIAWSAADRRFAAPKASYAAGGGEFRAAVEEMRERLFGHRRAE